MRERYFIVPFNNITNEMLEKTVCKNPFLIKTVTIGSEKHGILEFSSEEVPFELLDIGLAPMTREQILEVLVNNQ